MKKLLVLISILSLSLLSGCWDMDEINQRIFPYSMGVDLNEDSEDESDRYIITVVYPNIAAMADGGGGEEKIFIVSTKSSSIFQASRELSTVLPYPLYFKHLKVMVFGHEFAKNQEAVRQIIDGIDRDFVINKKIKLLTAEDTAKKLMEDLPKAKRQNVSEGPLYSMVIGNQRTSRYTPQTLTNFLKDTSVGGVSLIPRAAFKEEDLRVFGGCIYKDYKFIGHLTEEENRSIALMKGEITEDLMDTAFEGKNISYAITSTKAKKKLEEGEKEGEKIRIVIEIEIEGTLREYIFKEDSEGITLDLLKKMEKTLEKAIRDETRHTINSLQEKYKADALCIADFLEKFHPKLWKSISKDWEEVFPTIDIETKIKVHIRRRGLVL